MLFQLLHDNPVGLTPASSKLFFGEALCVRMDLEIGDEESPLCLWQPWPSCKCRNFSRHEQN